MNHRSAERQGDQTVSRRDLDGLVYPFGAHDFSPPTRDSTSVEESSSWWSCT